MQEKKGSRDRCDKPPCPPLKQQSQDWRLATSTGIRDTPLVPSGTVADIAIPVAFGHRHLALGPSEQFAKGPMFNAMWLGFSARHDF